MRAPMIGRAALAALTVLALAGCAGSSTALIPPPGVPKIPCGNVTIAVNPWVGYAANVAVVSYLLKHELGCEVVEKDLTESQSWEGLASGGIDVILENWGHDDLKKKYIDDARVAVELGLTGNKGVIGWYVPPWMAKTYPDIRNWKNLKLDYNVVYAGSEDRLIAAFQKAEANKTPLIGYFYEPQWLLSEIKLVHIPLPLYRPGCDANPKTVACDYQPYDLDKIGRKQFVDSGTPAAELIKNFSWTNNDQNSVARDLTVGKLSPDQAAKRWLDAHQDIWEKWLPKK